MLKLPPTENRVIHVTTADEILDHWAFFNEGRMALNDPSRARADYTPEGFFNMLVKVALMNTEGLILVLTDKNGNPLGFGCAFTGVDFQGDACFFVWECYSNSTCSTTTKELLNYTEEYAKSIGHNVIKLSTKRLTGAALRYFEGSLHFKREYIQFRKDI